MGVFILSSSRQCCIHCRLTRQIRSFDRCPKVFSSERVCISETSSGFPVTVPVPVPVPDTQMKNHTSIPSLNLGNGSAADQVYQEKGFIYVGGCTLFLCFCIALSNLCTCICDPDWAVMDKDRQILMVEWLSDWVTTVDPFAIWLQESGMLVPSPNFLIFYPFIFYRDWHRDCNIEHGNDVSFISGNPFYRFWRFGKQGKVWIVR